jgi:hypothetical protein
VHLVIRGKKTLLTVKDKVDYSGVELMKNTSQELRFGWLYRGLFTSEFLVVFLFLSNQGICQEKTDKGFLWSTPRSSVFLISPRIGWTFDSTDTQLNGLTIIFSGAYTLKYFLAGINAQAIFNEKGTLYSMGFDLIVRYGPFYVGGGFNGYWLPYRNNTPVPALVGQTGMHVPLPWEGLFLDLSYRSSLLFFESRQALIHTVLLGFLIEIGS